MNESGRAIEIGGARDADLAAAIALLAAQLDEHAIALDRATLDRAVRAIARDPALGKLLVARQDGRVVGVAVVSFLFTLEHGGRSAWLDELYVAPEARGLGIGRALTEEALRIAAEEGCVALDLEVEPGHEIAEGLYERMGFRRHARRRWMKRLESEPG
jgi:ribosomal protein S18 acetylase RimI-like enzyme